MLERPFVLPLALVAILGAEHAYFALLVDASFHQTPLFDFLRRMPVRIVNDLGGSNHIAPSYGDRFALLAIVETIGLGLVYRSLARPRPWQLVLVAVAAMAAVVDALSVHGGTSADMYSYVGFSLLGAHAYAPPSVPFPGAFSVINSWWQTPMVPAPYGPFWLTVAGAVAGTQATLFGKIVALRLLGALALLALVGVLVSLRMPPRVIALVALDPALVFEFVVNVHNDLFAVALLLGARLAATRGAIAIAVVLGVLAALVKLPFLIFAALALTPILDRRLRIASFVTIVVLALGISWFWGGPEYALALHHHADENTNGHATIVFSQPIVVLKLLAVLGIAIAFVSGTFVEGFAWALPTIGVALYPWYLSWGLTFSAASPTALRNFALALPLATFVTDTSIGNGSFALAIQLLAYGGLAFALVDLVRKRRLASLAA